MTAQLRPRLDSSVRLAEIEPEADLGFQTLYRVTRSGGRGSAKLPVPVIGILLYFDGQQSCDEIQDQIESYGIPLPQPDFVQLLAEQLERVGIVHMSERPTTTSGQHRFECENCANSCTGKEVGPLPEKEWTKLEDQWTELSAEHPELAGLEPLRRDDEGRVYLARPNNGACAFLGADRLCLIHKRYGFDEKPLPCRLFPLVAISAGEGVRVGLSHACMRLHRAFDTRGETNPVATWKRYREEVTPLKRRYIPPGTGHSAPITTTTEQNRDLVDFDLEEELIEWLQRGHLSLAELAHIAVFQVQPGSEIPLPVALANDLASLARRWADRVQDGAGWPSDLNPEVEDARNLIGLSNTLAGAELKPGRLNEIPERWQRYLAYRTRNQLWLREGHELGSMTNSLVFLVFSVACAAWYAHLGDTLPTDDVEDVAFERFGVALALFTKFGNTVAAHGLPPKELASALQRWEGWF